MARVISACRKKVKTSKGFVNKVAVKLADSKISLIKASRG
jgi:hypothetical protein